MNLAWEFGDYLTVNKDVEPSEPYTFLKTSSISDIFILIGKSA